MEELFVQESAIVTDKSTEEKNEPVIKQNAEGKDSRSRRNSRLFILMMKQLKPALNTLKVMNWQQEYGQTNMH